MKLNVFSIIFETWLKNNINWIIIYLKNEKYRNN